MLFFLTGDLEIPLYESESSDHLFMDIGTNGEIVIGNAEWMVACACSAGPAFEGAGIRCGMRAAEGARPFVKVQTTGPLRVGLSIVDEKKRAIYYNSELSTWW